MRDPGVLFFWIMLVILSHFLTFYVAFRYGYDKCLVNFVESLPIDYEAFDK